MSSPKMSSLGAIAKSLMLSSLIFLIFFYLSSLDTNHYYHNPSELLQSLKQKFPTIISTSSIDTTTTSMTSPTNLSHIVFGIVGSMNTWKVKKHYTESWWRPNSTRGYLFLDRPPTSKEFSPLWPSSSPPFRVNQNLRARFKPYPGFPRPTQVRIARTVLETFRQGDKDVRWYVMGDDDTVFVVDNLVGVLAKYDHTKQYYIGGSSECVRSNSDLSFDMAFGGAGYALSYPLAAVLAQRLDSCLVRYHRVSLSDFLLALCLSDLGVARTLNKGFHQIDLRRDISGLLSSHPQTPFLSLHHIDAVDPIFPNRTRSASINHLMTAARADPSRLLQQTVCHDRPTNWTLSVAWGYSAHIYESPLPRSFLRRPIETFRPWKRGYKPPLYTFNTRWPTANPCLAPHVFFFESVIVGRRGRVVTTYVRPASRGLPACSSAGNHSADHVQRIRVFSPANLPLQSGGRDCCEVRNPAGVNTTEVRYRPCMKHEITA